MSEKTTKQKVGLVFMAIVLILLGVLIIYFGVIQLLK